jgi:hypothetical protein
MVDYDLFINIQKYALAHAESSASHYQSRNQSTDKMFMNCLTGKLAEWCNYQSLIEAGYILEKPPCMLIFSQGNKSYDADLVVLGKDKQIYDSPKHVHVKSVSSETYKKYGASFLVQANDPIVKNPDEHHYYSVMLQVSLTEYKFHKWLSTINAVYKKPITNLPSKLAVYL